jgi:hypothetical protein
MGLPEYSLPETLRTGLSTRLRRRLARQLITRWKQNLLSKLEQREQKLPDTEPTGTVEPKPARKRKPAPKKTDTPTPKVTISASEAEAAVKKTTPTAKKTTTAKPSAASKNGSAKALPKAEPKQAAIPAEPPTPIDRAEDKLDELGKVVGSFLAGAAKRLRRAAAIGKEELEDLWAEAQSIRRGDVS